MNRIEYILNIVANYNHISVSDMKSKSRVLHLKDARYQCFMLLRIEGFTLQRIAHIFNKNHSTIIHGIQQHENLIITNKKYKELYYLIVSKMKAKELVVTFWNAKKNKTKSI